jgi:hypothetical protein
MNKRLLPLTLLATLMVAGMGMAETPPRPAPGQSRQESAPPAQPPKQRRDDARQAAPAQPAPARPAQDDSKRPQRLTPEERKELRQQINEAGHDLYPRKRNAP